jgi:hypothetical protein
MEERIAQRLAELKEAARTKEIELIVLRHLIAEYEALLAPAPTISGDPIGEELPA